ncbi:hypothetical protein [Microbacterium sp. BK668]|uniref:hypothetical protein n=1 Tax=Microbacterium sp. BK668 TaxID=2512118 RepID=UPI00105B6C26|nr:hypothetical protein [Microbacterium sp. BK668]TDN90820.1 hypothetical protein EV279_0312 [Microbacterium sp. BK668]
MTHDEPGSPRADDDRVSVRAVFADLARRLPGRVGVRRRKGLGWPARGRGGARSAGARHRMAVRALAYACDERDFSRLVRVLHPDATLAIDRGTEHPDRLTLVAGRAHVIDLVVRFLDANPDAVAVECPVDGRPGIALHTAREIVGVVTAELRAERISRLRLVVDPVRLRLWNGG